MWFDVLTIACLVLAAVACAYYALLTTVRGTQRLPASTHPHRFAILIPAHNEELNIGETLRAIRENEYPHDQVTTYVVADNCTDGTAQVAEQAGATVIVRTHETERGKGYTLAHGLATILPTRPDAVLMIDADCRLTPHALELFNRRLADGAEAVQGAIITGGSELTASEFVSAMGNVFDNQISRGRDTIGLAVPLRGMGMCFRRELLERHPWRCFGLTEDAEYSEVLTAAGVRVRFEPEVVGRTEGPRRASDLANQRRRWRAALGSGGRLFTKALESKPLVLAQLLLTGLFTFLSAGFGGVDLRLGWAVLVAITFLVYLRAACVVGVSWRWLQYAIVGPIIVARLAFVTLGGLRPRSTEWKRTRRNAELQAMKG